MAQTNRTDASTTAPVTAPAAIAEAIGAAGFLRLQVRPTPAAVVAAGLCLRVLDRSAIPYQVRLLEAPVPPTDGATEASTPVPPDSSEDVMTLGFGPAPGPVAYHVDRTHGPPPLTVSTIAEARGVSLPTGPLAAATVLAGGLGALEPLADRLRDDPTVERRPALGLPTDDLAGGLSASTRCHAPFSNRPDRVEALLDGLGLDPDSAAVWDPTMGPQLASLVAVEAIADPATPPRAADALAGFLDPYPLTDGSLRTVAGMVDVFEIMAWRRPAEVLAVAAGRGSPEPLVDTWFASARRVHAAVREVPRDPVDGVVALETDAPAASVVARLGRDFRTMAPAVLVTGGDVQALAVAPEALEAVVQAVDGVLPSVGSGPERVVNPDGTVLLARDVEPTGLQGTVSEVVDSG